MTTTQTGGGNGAAPDGGSKGQPRIVPDKPGWWWCMAWGGEPVPRQVIDNGRILVVNVAGVSESAEDSSCFEWLAPIPGPAVLAALAEYGEAEAAMLAVRRPERRDLFNATMVAHRKLLDAITAERGGAA